MKNIQKLSENASAQFHLLVIPNKGKGCAFLGDRPEFYRSFFQTANPVYLDEISEKVYKQAMDCHLNTEGHGLVAEKILATLAVNDHR